MYVAGKEGFKILQGDHIPRAPVHVEQTPAVAYNPHSGAPYRYSSGSAEEFDYSPPSPNHYRKPLSPLYHKAAGSAYSVHEDDDDDDRYNALPSKYSDYDDKGPHNFGSGYNFEFGSK